MDSIHDRDSAYRQHCAPIDKVTKRHRVRNIASDPMNIVKTQTNQEEYWHLSNVLWYDVEEANPENGFLHGKKKLVTVSKF